MYHTDSKKNILWEKNKYLREKVFIAIAKNNNIWDHHAR